MKKFITIRPLARNLNGRISTAYATTSPDQAMAYVIPCRKMNAITALPAATLPFVSKSAVHTVHSTKVTSIPTVAVKKSGRRPNLSIKKAQLTETISEQMVRQPLMMNCVSVSVILMLSITREK